MSVACLCISFEYFVGINKTTTAIVNYFIVLKNLKFYLQLKFLPECNK